MKSWIITLIALISISDLNAQEHQISLITPGALFVNRAAGIKLDNPSRFQFNDFIWLPSLEYIYRNPNWKRYMQVSLLWSIQSYPEQSQTNNGTVIWNREDIFLNISRLSEQRAWHSGALSFTYGLSLKYSQNDIHGPDSLSAQWGESLPLQPTYEFSFIGFNGGLHLDQKIWRRLYFSSSVRAVVFPIPFSYIGAKLDRYSFWFENGLGIRFGKY